MKKKLSQEELVLSHLMKYGSITSWDAIRKYHITRLSAIIYNLRSIYDIISKYETNKTTETTYVRYIYLGRYDKC